MSQNKHMPAGQIKAPQPALTSSAGLLAIIRLSENVFTQPVTGTDFRNNETRYRNRPTSAVQLGCNDCLLVGRSDRSALDPSTTAVVWIPDTGRESWLNGSFLISRPAGNNTKPPRGYSAELSGCLVWPRSAPDAVWIGLIY